MLCALLLGLPTVCDASPTRGAFISGKKSVQYEVHGEESKGTILILLHGAGGPDVQFYRQQAELFAAKGYTVLVPHYFDASGSSMPNDQNYVTWVQVVSDLIHECEKSPKWSNRKIALLGFSLGASVALAAGSQQVSVGAIADWYGSLPDEFLNKLKGMPPLLILHGNRDEIIPIINGQQLVRLCGIAKFACESHFYADQGHGFNGKALEDADNRTLDFFSRKLE
jgi:dienelactone hydrolase